jgi:hypothetical protein
MTCFGILNIAFDSQVRKIQTLSQFKTKTILYKFHVGSFLENVQICTVFEIKISMGDFFENSGD